VPRIPCKDIVVYSLVNNDPTQEEDRYSCSMAGLVVVGRR
jgi:hypothetical protein